VHEYREGKVKSTAMSGVKQFLKPDAYKQSEVQGSGIRFEVPGHCPGSWHLVSGTWVDGVPFV
jgi:hypothetical protein